MCGGSLGSIGKVVALGPVGAMVESKVSDALKGPDAPPAPDYISAARETAQGNLALAQQTAAANRVNQVTPYGSLMYSSAGKDAQGNPTYTATQTLSPEQQQLLNYQNQLSGQFGNLANQNFGQVQSSLSHPLDTSQLPAQQINPGQTAQDALMSRLEPYYNRSQSQLETQLANQGLQRGSEAWNNAMTDFNKAKNDAYMSAAAQGINIGEQARQQALNEQMTLRQDPLNTLNALRQGMQFQQPSYINAPQQANVMGPDIMGATNANYAAQMNAANLQAAQQNALMQGLFSLGSAGAMAFSDRRLKSNIVRIGDHPLGIGIYSYEIFGKPDIGVMADEVESVKPEAVLTHPSGYKMVNYGVL